MMISGALNPTPPHAVGRLYSTCRKKLSPAKLHGIFRNSAIVAPRSAKVDLIPTGRPERPARTAAGLMARTGTYSLL